MGMTTSTKMAMATTTITGTGAATTYAGAMTLQFEDAAAFVSSEDAPAIMEHSIAAANAAISKNMVAVTSVALARRLSAKPRDLAAGGVKVEYTVTFPAGHSSPPLTKDSFDTTALKTAIKTKAQESGLNVTVTSVEVADPTPTVTTGTTATTGGPTDGATASTGLLALVCAVLMAALAA